MTPTTASPQVRGDDLVRALVRGADLTDLAWARAVAPEAVMESARAAVVALAPELASRVEAQELGRVCDYLLRRQNAGQAAGTWAMMQRRASARRFALAAREALAPHYRDEPPPIPARDGTAAEGREAVERAADPSVADEPGVAIDSSDAGRARARRRERRRERARRREAGVRAARRSPFRRAAMRHFSEGREQVSLPNYAPRQIVWVLWGIFAIAVAVVVLVLVARVPTPVSGAAYVTTEGLPKGEVGAIVVLASGDAKRLRPGDEVRLELPGVQSRAVLRIDDVPGVLSARRIVRRYGLGWESARTLGGPGAVAVGRVRRPAGARPLRDYAGPPLSASISLGSKSVRSLVPVIGG